MKIEIISGKKWKYRLPQNETFIFEYFVVSPIDIPYIYMVDHLIQAQKGYCWDGSSIPLKRITKFLSFGFWDSDKYCKIASLHHDVCYQLMKLGFLNKAYKDHIDEVYKLECVAGGMPKWEANLRFWALQKFASVDKKEKPIKIIEV